MGIQCQDFHVTIDLRTIGPQRPAFFYFLEFRFLTGDRKNQRKQAKEQKGMYFCHVTAIFFKV